MNFEKILENGRLWAVVYEEDGINILEKVFTQWTDFQWLREFLLSLGIVDYKGFEDYNDESC